MAHLLVHVLLQEGEQQQEALRGGDHTVALLQALACSCGPLVVNAHIEGSALEGQACQVFHLPGESTLSAQQRLAWQCVARPCRCDCNAPQWPSGSYVYHLHTLTSAYTCTSDHMPDLAEAARQKLSTVSGVATQGQKAGLQPNSACPILLAWPLESQSTQSSTQAVDKTVEQQLAALGQLPARTPSNIQVHCAPAMCCTRGTLEKHAADTASQRQQGRACVVCVALKSMVWRLRGSAFTICLISSSNPISRIRSASSMTRQARLRKMKPCSTNRMSNTGRAPLGSSPREHACGSLHENACEPHRVDVQHEALQHKADKSHSKALQLERANCTECMGQTAEALHWEPCCTRRMNNTPAACRLDTRPLVTHRSVLQMVQQAPRGGHQQIDSFDQLLCLCAPVCTAHDQACRVVGCCLVVQGNPG